MTLHIEVLLCETVVFGRPDALTGESACVTYELNKDKPKRKSRDERERDTAIALVASAQCPGQTQATQLTQKAPERQSTDQMGAATSRPRLRRPGIWDRA